MKCHCATKYKDILSVKTRVYVVNVRRLVLRDHTIVHSHEKDQISQLEYNVDLLTHKKYS